MKTSEHETICKNNYTINETFYKILFLADLCQSLIYLSNSLHNKSLSHFPSTQFSHASPPVGKDSPRTRPSSVSNAKATRSADGKQEKSGRRKWPFQRGKDHAPGGAPRKGGRIPFVAWRDESCILRGWNMRWGVDLYVR